MANIGSAIVFINGNTQGLNKALGDAERSVRQSMGNILTLGNRLGSAMTITGVGIMGAMGYMAKGAADFDEGLHKVNTVAKLSGDDLKKLGKQVTDLSNEVGIKATDALDALYQALSAGVPPENAIDFLRTSAKASIGGFTDLFGVVDGVTSAVNAYRVQGLSAKDATDRMFKAVELGKTTFGELAASMANVTPIAASAGVSFDEVNAAIAQLTLGGTKTAEATTQIRAAIVSLLNPNETMTFAIKQLGFESGGAMLKQLGLMGTMQKLSTVQGFETEKTRGLKNQLVELGNQYYEAQNKLSGLTAEMPKTAAQSTALANKKTLLIERMKELSGKINTTKQEYATFAIRGNEGIVKALGSVEALGLYLGSTGGSAQGMAVVMNEVKNSTGAADKAYQEMNESAKRKYDALMAQVGNLRISLGNKLLPAFLTLAEKMEPILTKTAEWIEKNPILVDQILRIGLGIGAFNMTAGSLLTVLPGAISLFGGLSKATSFLAGGGIKALIGLGGLAGGGLLGLSLAIAGIVGAAGIGWEIGRWIDNVTRDTRFGIWIDSQMDSLVGLIEKMKEWLGFQQRTIDGRAAVLGENSQAALASGFIPGMASGGVSLGGLTLVGERGPELVSMPRGSRVFSNRESQSMAVAAGGGDTGPMIGSLTVNWHSPNKPTPEEAKAILNIALREVRRGRR